MEVLFNKGDKIIMRQIFVILLFNSLFVQIFVSQNLIQQIDDVYNVLDSIYYIENVILSYKEDKLKQIRATEDLRLELRGVYTTQRQRMLDSVMEKFDTMVLSYRENLIKKKVWEEIHSTFAKQIADAYLHLDGSTQRQNIYDSIIRDFSRISMERDYSMFISAINDKPVHYVLNLISTDNQTLRVDTGKLSFNLFYFDKYSKLNTVVFVREGQYSWYNSSYPTFSRQIGKNAPKVLKKILRKNPRYLLYCYDLESENTVLYILNDKIYVYRIAQMEEYELSNYIEKFNFTKKISYD